MAKAAATHFVSVRRNLQQILGQEVTLSSLAVAPERHKGKVMRGWREERRERGGKEGEREEGERSEGRKDVVMRL